MSDLGNDAGREQARRLAMAMARDDITAGELAQAIGCDEATFHAKACRSDEFTVGEIKTLSKRLGLDAEEIGWIFFE